MWREALPHGSHPNSGGLSGPKDKTYLENLINCGVRGNFWLLLYFILYKLYTYSGFHCMRVEPVSQSQFS